MPRSPYTGTFQPNLRPTVKVAPDALVYVNGETTITACKGCKRKFDLNQYVTSISVDLNVENAPGSASFNLTVPYHSVDEFLVDGEPILTPMMEVEFFSKGYFLVEGVPQYYPIFWGMITEVTGNYSDGFYTYAVSCVDILKWWDLCQMNVNPAFTNPVGTQLGRSIFGNVFFGKNPYDVIWTLAQQSMGDVIVGTSSLTSMYKDGSPVFKDSIKDMMVYWESRFARMRSGLLLYGVNGGYARGDSLWQQYKTGGAAMGQPFASSMVAKANGGVAEKQPVFDPTDPNVTAFRTQFMNAGQINFWQSEFTPKSQLAQACKEAIGFELYMDVDGSIVFKPPFYNLDVLENKPISWIQDIDIISEDFSESEAEVVTQLQIAGSLYGNVDYGLSDVLTPNTAVTDYHLLRQFGWRPQQINSEFLGSPQSMFYHGMDILDRLNSKRFRGTITIPHRPELRLGFPVYIPHREQFWYVQGISHSVEMGGRATTTLTLTAKRGKFSAPRGIASFHSTAGSSPNMPSKEVAKTSWMLEMGEAATFPPTEAELGPNSPYEPLNLRHPKTGKKLGFPNAVMVHTRPFAPTPEQMAMVKGENPRKAATYTKNKKQQEEAQKRAEEEAKIADKGLSEDEYTQLHDKVANNRHNYGLTSAGVYVYAHDTGSCINQLALVPSKNISVKGQKAPKFDQSVLIRPVSDDRGFEVVGHFRYGRGVTLRDGSLVITDNEDREKVNVETPVALTGDLLTMLTAQSQGITTEIAPHKNPALTLSTLAPEDSMTAATISPEGHYQVHTPNATYMGTAAPLDSAQNKGMVEAGQLSNALTLAEMSINHAPGDGVACSCLLSRADLAFLPKGKRLKTETSTVVLDDNFFEEPQPVAALTIEEVQSRIDGYLYDLYEKLDTPYREYMDSLSGKTTNQDPDFLDLSSQAPKSNLDNPPWSGVSRLGLGDPRAIAKMGRDAASNLAQAASGEDIQRAQRKAALQRQIALLQAERSKQEDTAAIDQEISQLTLHLNSLGLFMSILRPDPFRQFVGTDQPYKYLTTGIINRVDPLHMKCDVALTTGGMRYEVDLTQGMTGPRSFWGGVPEPGSVVVLGFRRKHRNLVEAVIVGYLPVGNKSGLRFDPYAPAHASEISEDEQEIYQEIYGSPIRYKRLELLPGDVGGMSSKGAELVLSDSLNAVNRAGDGFLYRDSDRTYINHAQWVETISAGSREVSGAIRRGDLYVPYEEGYLGSDVLAQTGPEGPYRFLTKDGLNGRVNQDLPGTVTYSDGRKALLVGSLDAPKDFFFVEKALYLDHSTDLIDSVSGDLDGFDLDQRSPYISVVHGTLVGAHPWTTMGQRQYGKILKPTLFSDFRSFADTRLKLSEVTRNPTNGDIEAFTRAGAFYYEMKPPRGNDKFIAVIEKQGKLSLQIPGSSVEDQATNNISVEALLLGGLKAKIGASKPDNVSVDLRLDGGFHADIGHDAGGQAITVRFHSSVQQRYQGTPDSDNVAIRTVVQGDSQRSVSGQDLETVQGSKVVIASGQLRQEADRFVLNAISGYSGNYGEKNELVAGKTQLNYALQVLETIVAGGKVSTILAGGSVETIGAGAKTVTVAGGAYTTNVAAGAYTVTVGTGAITVTTGAGAIAVTTGAGAMSLTAGGAITLTAGLAINLTASTAIALTSPQVLLGGPAAVLGVVRGAPILPPSTPSLDFFLNIPYLGCATIRSI